MSDKEENMQYRLQVANELERLSKLIDATEGQIGKHSGNVEIGVESPLVNAWVKGDRQSVIDVLRTAGEVAIPVMTIAGILAFAIKELSSYNSSLSLGGGGEVTDALVNCFSHDTGLFALGDIGIFFH